ncbi:MAG: glutamine synthetase family protein [Candidatus Methanomethylicia archaeon]|nr:glutamine synthetase family protein [Candidatus Methanomethylicia archaeon]
MNTSSKKLKYLKPIIIDLNGKPRGLILKNFKSIDCGVCFDGSSVKGHASVEESDLIAKPDMKTVREIDLGKRIITLAICDVEKTSGENYKKNTRMKLKEHVREMENYGFKFKVGIEIEYFIVKKIGRKIKPLDRDQYFEIAPYARSELLQLKIMEKLDRIGIEIEKTHHEVGEGQYECSIKASDPISMADNVIIAKMVMKEVVKKHGFEVTFMPKPFINMNGSGMHIHVSLLSGDNRNRFYNIENDCLSLEALYAVGGLLKNAREISLLVAPTVNSYKRLKPGYEAPNKICWGYGNRSTLIRIPKLINEDTCRVEYRHPDPSCNPYLAILAVITSIEYGVTNRIEPIEPCKENVYKIEGKYETLPSNLGEAINVFENGKFIFKVLGEEIYTEIIKVKKIEWMEYLDYISRNKLDDNDITDWEIEKYLVKT